MRTCANSVLNFARSALGSCITLVYTHRATHKEFGQNPDSCYERKVREEEASSMTSTPQPQKMVSAAEWIPTRSKMPSISRERAQRILSGPRPPALRLPAVAAPASF